MIPTQLHTEIDRTKDRSLHCPGYAGTETALDDGPSEGRSAVATRLTPYYQDSRVTIYHGDCRTIMPHLQPFDLLLTDPPYGIGADKAMHKASGNVVGHGNRRVAKRTYEASDWDAKRVEDWVMFLARRLCEKQIIWGGNYYELPATSCILVWDKENDGNNFADCEIAWTNLKGAVRMKRHLWNGMARKNLEPRDHPTQKPLELMSWALSLAGDVEAVLDPWMGSGTTLRACKDHGKQCVGIEREEKYCEIAAKRMQQECLEFNDPVAGASEARAGIQDQAAPRHNQY